MTKEDILKLGFFSERRYLSNMYRSPINIGGNIFPSSENYYQYMKSDSADLNIFKKITPEESKKLGRELPINPLFIEVKLDVMYEAVYAKFIQNNNLKKLLIDTGEEELIEHNYWQDKFWGKHFGEGENNLGKILMKVRKEIK